MVHTRIINEADVSRHKFNGMAKYLYDDNDTGNKIHDLIFTEIDEISKKFGKFSNSQESTNSILHHGYILALESVTADTAEIIKQMRTCILYLA